MTATRSTSIRPASDPRTEAYHVEHSPHSPWPVSTTVVLGIASLTDLEPTSMLPLHSAVDPDALNRHVSDIRDRHAELSFEFQGYRVTVRGDGHIRFVPHEDTSPDSSDDGHPAAH